MDGLEVRLVFIPVTDGQSRLQRAIEIVISAVARQEKPDGDQEVADHAP